MSAHLASLMNAAPLVPARHPWPAAAMAGRISHCESYGEGDTAGVFGFEAGAERRLSAAAVCDCRPTSHRRRNVEDLALTDLAPSQPLLSYAMRGMAQAQDHPLLLGRLSAVERVAAFLLQWRSIPPAAKRRPWR